MHAPAARAGACARARRSALEQLLVRCFARARHAAGGVRLRPQVCLTTNKEEFHEMREYREALEGTLEQARQRAQLLQWLVPAPQPQRLQVQM